MAMKQYMIDFPDELHREAKVRAAQEGITLKDLIIKAVEAYLKPGKNGKA
jgi:predicted HicB family RNase H-like nuclease